MTLTKIIASIKQQTPM